MLSDGFSSINNVQAIINEVPFSSTWITTEEIRTPYVTLDANPYYWNKQRGPRLDRVVFRNDISPQEALNLCMSTEGQVDLVNGVAPKDAEKVRTSRFANLVNVHGNKAFVGLFNRYRQDVNYNDQKVRLAFNLGVDRARFIQEGFYGYASEVPALTPPWALDFPEDLQPRAYQPSEARRLLREVGWPEGKAFTIATMKEFEQPALVLAEQLRESLQISVNVTVFSLYDEVKLKRMIAEKRLTPSWDLYLGSTSALFLETTPAFFHREFFGMDGALRTGPVIPEFEALLKKLSSQVNRQDLLEVSKEIDRYVYKEALGLFLCSPQDLYAVNKQVLFRPYRTSLEFAETEVSPAHWSRR
ncbi:ABC transporter substrate-binding protein [Bacillus mesophilus]|uniref:ABC transporter substrate-binding protein n=1 Tax=Bacillus mesophilus TaxID=1808955 RepID=A0A6M0QD54_9BACI|nr:ABC transporter substrate-binding protein [Bacillus mesophilus]